MLGCVPPPQSAFIHVANAFWKTVSASPRLTWTEASFCIVKPMQRLLQKSGVPQSSGAAGVHTCHAAFLVSHAAVRQ